MKSAAAVALATVVATCAVSCMLTVTPPAATELTVELYNPTSLTLDANFFLSATATDAAGLFVRENIFTGYSSAPIPTLGPGQTVSFVLTCADTASIGVQRPVFSNPLTISGGRAEDEVILRRDGGFHCGDHVRFVYFSEGDVFRVRADLNP